MRDASKNYILNKTKNITKNILFGLGFLVLIMSLFNIEIFKSSTEIVDGNEIIFILDTSKSMDTEDVSYNSNKISRLNFSKEMIKNFITSNPSNSYGLIAFAENANIISPTTNEFGTFFNFLDNLNSKTISKGGTNFYEALNLGIGTAGKNTEKNFIIISDGGEAEDKIDSINIKKIIAGKKIKIFTAGVGTTSGDKIPNGTDFFGNTVYKTFEDKYVVSKLYEKNLQEIKDLGAGKYIKASGIDSINKLKSYFINSTNSKKINKNNESQRYLIIISGILISIGYIIPNKTKKGAL